LSGESTVGRVARFIRVLSALGLAWAAAGCSFGSPRGADRWTFERAAKELARSTRKSRVRAPATPQVKPAAPDVKPSDSVEDSDDRHPSRWKRKLKASYA
jgi:hypothetical protein